MNTAAGRLRLQALTGGDLAWIAQLAADADSAAALGIQLPSPGVSDPAALLEAAAAWLEHTNQERSAGRRHLLGVGDGRELGALVALEKIGAGEARLVLAVIPPLRRHGIGRFAVEQILLYAFQSLRLDRVGAHAPSSAACDFLTAMGFHAHGARSSSTPGMVAEFQFTRRGWQEHRNAPALAALHTGLRAILHRELAAGNEIVETGRGWPDADSVFVKLKRELTVPRDALPAGISYNALNDPHWWMEEFASEKPRHILAR